MLNIRHFTLLVGALLVGVAVSLDNGVDHHSTTPCTTSTTSTPCPLSTVTTTTTTTSASLSPNPTPAGACLLANPLCAASGLNIDYYANPFGGYSSGSLPSSYYLTEGLTPLDSSFTNTTFFPQNVDPSLPSVFPDPSLPTSPYFVGWVRATDGGVTVDANNFTVVYQGFYRAPASGTFTLCTTADNENDVFFGDGSAFGCLDGAALPDAEPLIRSTGASFVNGINCTDVELIGGFYYPVRNVMGNWQGPSAFNFTIQAPGVAFADRANEFPGDVFPYDCGVFI